MSRLAARATLLSRALVAGLLAAMLFAAALFGPAPLAAAPVSDEGVHEVAAQLSCVVCLSLSVADSPSETAHQMKAIIRERLAAGESPEQVKAYFVDKYGLWILLSPPRQGFTLLVWVVPFAGLAAGLVLVLLVVKRWSRRPGTTAPAARPDEAMRARISQEMAERDRAR